MPSRHPLPRTMPAPSAAYPGQLAVRLEPRAGAFRITFVAHSQSMCLIRKQIVILAGHSCQHSLNPPPDKDEEAAPPPVASEISAVMEVRGPKWDSSHTLKYHTESQKKVTDKRF
jgi:hypothetical protein